MIDHAGRGLKVGDRVLIPCTVVQIHFDPQSFPRSTTITVETDYPATRDADPPDVSRIYLEAAQVDKVTKMSP